MSGAGVSTDSGIQDFRGPTGVWTLNPGSQAKYTFAAFMADAELRGRYWQSRYEHPVWAAEPNAAHLAVASLVGSDIDTTVVTQNTDGLHQRAGTPADRVVELHGTMHVVVCVACDRRSPTTDVLSRMAAGEPTPPCTVCGGVLKTASTMFGQTMSPAVYARAEEAVTSADLVLAVGTTLTVEPAGSLCASAVRAGATLVIVNWDPTPYDGIATEIIRDPLGEALPRIVAQLRAGIAQTAAAADETLTEAAVTALLCGTADEGRNWRDAVLEPADEDLVAAFVTPKFLLGMLTETTEEQDRRTLTILARAAETRPELRVCLTELLSVLPGASPAAVDAAVHGGHPGPLADALTALAKNAALPAELLDAVPAGTTVLGEFPVLLAESLVEAYEQRAATYPATALPGLTRMLVELADRLTDLSRTDEAAAALQRAREVSRS